MLASIFTAIAATAAKAVIDQVPWTYAALVVAGSAIGTQAGVRLTHKIPAPRPRAC
jgi:uncharacterized membrane protein YfcA